MEPSTSADSDNEQDLIRAARAGSPDAAEILCRDYWAGAYKAAYLVTGDAGEAEDVVQEAFIAALRSLGRFRDGKPFAPWLHRIVVNKGIDALRAQNRRPTPTDPSRHAEGAKSPSSDKALSHAIGRLPIDQRAVVVLRFVLGYGPEEIANLLDLPRGTVGSRLRRALDALRADLEDEG